MPARLVDLAECRDVGGDDDAAGRAGKLPSLRVDDWAARPDQVDGAVGLAVRERRVSRAVQNLNRPGAQRENAERDPDERRKAADPDEEAGAAEVRRVDARVRLEAAAAGKIARELDPAPGIGG
jgi:hypothetical protein